MSCRESLEIEAQVASTRHYFKNQVKEIILEEDIQAL